MTWLGGGGSSMKGLKNLISQKKSNLGQGKTKVVARRDAEEQRKEAYLAEQAAREEARQAKRRKLAGTDEASAASVEAKAQEPGSKKGEEAAWMQKKDVVRRLRERGHPATLFAEDDAARRKRLQTVLSQEISLEDVTILNELTQKERLRQAAEDSLAADKQRLELGQSPEEAAAIEKKKVDASVAEKEVKLLGKRVSLHQQQAPDELKPDVDSAYACVLLFVETAFLEWEIEQLKLPPDAKKTDAAKQAAAIREETVAFLKPLLDALHKRTLQDGLLVPFHKIAYLSLQKQYRSAVDCYLKMAIGSSQWPLGVTQVGIHSRVGRERIGANKQAHILNNETQRKYIQTPLLLRSEDWEPSESSRS
eukprot:gene11587-17852_t